MLNILLIRKAINNTILNEKYIDKYFFEKYLSEKNNFSKSLPRAQARFNFFNKHKNLYKYLEIVLTISWKTICIFLIILDFLKFTFRVWFFVKEKQFSYVELFIINSSVSYSLSIDWIKKNNLKDDEIIFFVTANSQKKQIEKKYNIVLSSNLISKKNYFNIVYNYFKVLFSLEKSNFNYSFLTFKWFTLFVGLDKLNFKNLHSFDHYDRYAILADSVKENKGSYVNYFFHQHGSLSSNYNMPCKLKNIDVAILLNKLSIKNFYLLSQKQNVKLLINKRAFNTVEIEKTQKKRILIIGNLACKNFHIKLVKMFSSVKNNIVIYYKPHPNNISLIKQYSFCLNIVDHNIFPLVDLVISYNSTLLDDYIEAGFNYISHDINSTNPELIFELSLEKLNL